MDRLQAQLSALQQALIQPPGPPPSPAAVANVAPFICGIERKSKFVQLHSTLLAGVRWDRLESIGRRMPGGAVSRRQLAQHSENAPARMPNCSANQLSVRSCLNDPRSIVPSR